MTLPTAREEDLGVSEETNDLSAASKLEEPRLTGQCALAHGHSPLQQVAD